MSVEVFHKHDSLLAEGPVWNRARSSLMWVDILRSELWEKNLDGETSIWHLGFVATAIFECNHTREAVWLVTSQGVGQFNFLTTSFELIYPVSIPDNMRTNDAGLLHDGTLVFGTMENEPSGAAGELMALSKESGMQKIAEGIGIPNAFVAKKESIFIADSLRQRLFNIPVSVLLANKINFNDEHHFFFKTGDGQAPDGGCLDETGLMWNAIWGGGKVVNYDNKGDVKETIHLPVRQPSSCCFGGKDNRLMFITSASEGLTKKELEEYPLSGSIFVRNMDLAGINMPYARL